MSYRLKQGKYAGELITRAPISYLKALVSHNSLDGYAAIEELERRGTKLAVVEITTHAIDRASQRCLGRWLETRKKNEGIYSWLVRMADCALTMPPGRDGRYKYGNLFFVIKHDGLVPTLVTILDDLRS